MTKNRELDPRPAELTDVIDYWMPGENYPIMKRKPTTEIRPLTADERIKYDDVDVDMSGPD